MIDRRFLIAACVALLAVFGVRLAMSSDTATPAPVVTATSRIVDAVNGPYPSPAASTTVLESQPVADVVEAVVPVPVGGVVPVELGELVAGARPTLPAEMVDDGQHDTANAQQSPDPGDAAAQLVVTAWTWRFDDAVDRQSKALRGLATDEVVVQLAPTLETHSARSDAGEVSWVIVSDTSIDGDVVTVRFDQHIVTSTAPETITARVVAVTLHNSQAVEASE